MRPRHLSSAASWLLLAVIFSAPLLSGCAAALIAGGAVGGYAIAKDMEDGELIDTQRKKDDGNKGWFGGGK